MVSELLHRLQKTREQAHTLICMARTLRAETLDLQGHLYELHWRFLEQKLYYRYVVQGSRGKKNSGLSSKGVKAGRGQENGGRSPLGGLLFFP
jgi:hypothetical protein